MPGTWTDEARAAVSSVLTIVAVVLLLLGGVALYAREEIVNADHFADRAVEALQREEVRRVVSREVVANFIDRGSTNLVSARPLLETAINTIVGTPPFRRLFRFAVRDAHRLMFDREQGNVILDVADTSRVVADALRSVSPATARKIPTDVPVELVELRNKEFATEALRVADDIRLFGILLPIVGLVLLVGGVAVAFDRRAAVTRAGVAVGAAAGLLVVALIVLRYQVVTNITGTTVTTEEEARAAAGEIFDVYFQDLRTWALFIGGGALVLAAAAASLVRAEDVTDEVEEWWRGLARPRTPTVRALRAVGALVAGVLLVARPTLAIQIIAVVAGAFLLFFGTTEVLAMLQPRLRRTARPPEMRRRPLLLGGAAALVIVAGVAMVLTLALDEDEPKQRLVKGPVKACNGLPQLCDRRLNEVVFPGTHNSMSAADRRGWLLVNQVHDIPRQLQDGIRLLLIDPHYGVRDGSRVRTDFQAEGSGYNRVAKALSPEALLALERLGGRVGLGDLSGQREVYLCHTVCELGATRMVDTLKDVRRFLDGHPGEVVILFLEPYVKVSDLVKVFRDAGLDDYVASLDRDQPLPTLRELIRSGRRLVVLTERDLTGTEPDWLLPGFSFVQDTPLKATRVSQFSCDVYRGTADSPLLMINHWIDRFPPRLEDNRNALKPAVIRDRGRRCERERKLLPTLFPVDFYDQGDIVKTAAAFNRQPVEPGRTRG